MQTAFRHLLAALLLGVVSGSAWGARPAPHAGPVLAPGDVIQLTVVGEPDLTRPVAIKADGTVSLGYLGKARIAGMTPDGAALEIRRVLKRFLKDPAVSVELAENRFSVMGAVQRPGQYTMIGDRVAVLDALAQAGGPSDRANLRSATLVRQTRSGPRKVRVDIYQAMKGEGATALPQMQPGDMLFIERRKQPIGAALLTVAGAAASLAWLLR